MPEEQGADQGATHTEEDQTAQHLKAARAEAKEWRAKFQEAQGRLSKLDELEDASRSELEKAANRAAKAEQAAQSASLEALRWQVAAERGLPAALARRLQGSTKAELEADADDLVQMAQPRRVPDAGNHSNGQGPLPNDPNRYIREQIAKRR